MEQAGHIETTTADLKSLYRIGGVAALLATFSSEGTWPRNTCSSERWELSRLALPRCLALLWIGLLYFTITGFLG